ncbi:MAG: hypothetical protein AABX51_08260 [Nanoarchaeota archaeon]
MAYVVTDGKSRHEFDTLKEAVEFRSGVPMPIFRSDNLGNLKRIQMAEISAAVQREDYGLDSPFEPEKEASSGNHIKSSLIFIFGILAVVVALFLLWFVLKEVSK